MNTTENEHSNVVAINSFSAARIIDQIVDEDPLQEVLGEEEEEAELEEKGSKIHDIAYKDFSAFNSASELLEHLRDIQNKIHYYVDEIETNLSKSRS